jgi:hypothetical protein
VACIFKVNESKVQVICLQPFGPSLSLMNPSPPDILWIPGSSAYKSGTKNCNRSHMSYCATEKLETRLQKLYCYSYE